MTATITREAIEKIIAANAAFNEALTSILSTMSEERWVTPAEAEAETGIKAQTIRWMVRNGKIESRRKGPQGKLIEVKLSDLLA